MAAFIGVFQKHQPVGWVQVPYYLQGMTNSGAPYYDVTGRRVTSVRFPFASVRARARMIRHPSICKSLAIGVIQPEVVCA
jgi:hypothetical protein